MKILIAIFLAVFNIIFFITYFVVNLILMLFYGFRLPKVSPYHVSNPYRGKITEREFFCDEFVQSREFPYIPKTEIK